jgi:hypothetical protein
LEVLTDAMLLRACRKYAAWLNNGASEPIASIRYFDTLLEEIQERPFPPGYRDHMRLEVEELTGPWAESKRGQRPVLHQTEGRALRERRRDDTDALR